MIILPEGFLRHPVLGLSLDRNGTLVTIDQAVHKAAAEAFAEQFGEQSALSAYVACQKDGETRFSSGAEWIRTICEQFNVTINRLRAKELLQLVQGIWLKHAQLQPDTKKTLQTLRHAGFRLGINSNCTWAGVAITLGLRLDQLIDGAVHSCEVGESKPNAGIYLNLARRLEISTTSMVHVDDNLACVRGAPMRGIFLAHPDMGYHEAELRNISQESGCGIIDGIHELTTIFTSS